jgi:hypothetical protein
MIRSAYQLATESRPNGRATQLRGGIGIYRRSARARRGGFTSVGTLMLIIIGIVTLMLTVNWAYLVLVNRHTFRLTDNLALSAVRELLDEGRLEDAPGYVQADDVAAAQNLITQPTSGLLSQTNAAAGKSLRPTTADVQITAGRIDDASQPIAGGNAFVSPAGADPFNTLRVEVLRSPTGLNPVQLMIRGFGSPNAARIHSASYATLDSRAVGFRPTASASSPVAPIALDQSAWFSTRANGGDDQGLLNGRYELDFTLRSTSGGGLANCALVGLNESGSLNAAIVPAQIVSGVVPADVQASGFLGPATPADPLPLDAERNSPANVSSIADALNTVAQSKNPRRAFPIYAGSFADPLNVVGFIGARILDADADDDGSGPRLRVRLEPDFIVHSTVVTSRRDAASAEVPENLYIHKIRLTR